MVIACHPNNPELADQVSAGGAPDRRRRSDGKASTIRPERFLRLVTLAGMLIDAAREGRKVEMAELCAQPPDVRAPSCAGTSTC